MSFAEVWWCPECRAAGAADEDGCCTTCGSDCEIRPGDIRAFVHDHDTDPGDVDPALVGSYVTAALEAAVAAAEAPLRTAVADLQRRSDRAAPLASQLAHVLRNGNAPPAPAEIPPERGGLR